MSLYKLFYIIHRRTDFVRLYRFERRAVFPEWYAEKQELCLARKHRQNLIELLGVAQVLSMSLDHGYYM